MSIGDFLYNLPMDKFKMLLGMGLALIGVIPFFAGVAFLAVSPGSLDSALVIIGAGGSIIAAGLTLLAVNKANDNGNAIQQALSEIKNIKVCGKPESEPWTCVYEKSVDMAVVAQ